MDKISNVCKIQDIIKSGINLFLRESDHGSVKIHIFKTGIFHIKSCAQLQKCGDTAVYLYLAFCRSQHAGNDL